MFYMFLWVNVYLYQVGNTSSNKNTEYKKLGPRLERGLAFKGYKYML